MSRTNGFGMLSYYSALSGGIIGVFRSEKDFAQFICIKS
jgi:hypothetical protein